MAQYNYINEGKPIYITYARNKSDHPGWEHIADIKDVIVMECSKYDIDVWDDDGDLKVGDRITEFETEIGESEFTIVIFSDKYFRSPHCMYELVQVMNAFDKKRKVVCIKSDNCNLKDPIYLRELEKYWIDYGGERYKEQLSGIKPNDIQEAAQKNGYYIKYVKELSSFFDKCKYLNADTLDIDDIDAFINDFKVLFEAEYYLFIDNQQTGPYDIRTLKRKFRLLPKSTLVWKNGMADWAQAFTIPELKSMFPIEPPPIPKIVSSAKVIEKEENHIITPDQHSTVDLGLSVLWATCNIGANNPWEYGDRFAWGETNPKKQYNWKNYKYANDDYTIIKYCNFKKYGYNGFTDNYCTLLPEDDAATVNWHGDWRMPTVEEFDELREKCKWNWEKNYQGHEGINGCIVQGNDNHIFLPAPFSMGSGGDYWSSLLFSEAPNRAHDLDFYLGKVRSNVSSLRYDGIYIRPVCPKN